MTFEGFPQRGLSFLNDLAAHNDRDWFEAHRASWDDDIVPCMLAWCEELAQRLRRDAMPKLVFVPRVGGSLYRPVRDVRFSKNKQPYKTYTAALLWEGSGEKQDSPGVYLRVSAEEVLLGGGIWQFEEAILERFRKKLLAEKSAAALEEALGVATNAGMKIDGPEKLARPPRGFSGEHPRAELSKHKGLVVTKSLKPGPWLHTREAVDRAEELARAYAPLHAWMRDELC